MGRDVIANAVKQSQVWEWRSLCKLAMTGVEVEIASQARDDRGGSVEIASSPKGTRDDKGGEWRSRRKLAMTGGVVGDRFVPKGDSR